MRLVKDTKGKCVLFYISWQQDQRLNSFLTIRKMQANASNYYEAGEITSTLELTIFCQHVRKMLNRRRQYSYLNIPLLRKQLVSSFSTSLTLSETSCIQPRSSESNDISLDVHAHHLFINGPIFTEFEVSASSRILDRVIDWHRRGLKRPPYCQIDDTISIINSHHEIVHLP